MSGGTYLAFDYGSKRIGTAVGDSLTQTARPLAAIAVHAQPDWAAVDKLIHEWRPAALIVGLPLDEDGSEQAITEPARRFARSLEQRSGLQVHLIDERYSSRAADYELRDARSSGRMNRRVRKGDRDGQAARIVLEQWLAEQG